MQNFLNRIINNSSNLLNNEGYFYNPGDSYENLTNLSEQIGDVRVGVKDITKIYDDLVLTEKTDCLICREEYEIGDTLKKLKCNHIFCDSCCKEWFGENKKCPVCLTEYED